MPHELFLTTRQTAKLRNAFGNNMAIDIKLSKTQIPKTIQSDGFFGSWLASFRKKALTNIAVPLATDNLPGLVSNLTSNAITKFERKNKWKRSFQSRKRIYFISNKDMNDIRKIIKSLEDLGVLIDGGTETVKDEIKKKVNFLELC